jgi:transcription elongation factor Elf1
MNCPRCDGTLVTFALEASDRSAVVCESCGFTGISASHAADERDIESWEQAMGRFADATAAPERLCQTSRTESIALPTEEDNGDSDLDTDRVESERL